MNPGLERFDLRKTRNTMLPSHFLRSWLSMATPSSSRSSQGDTSNPLCRRRRLLALSKSARRGATVVEAALVLPVFLLFLFFILQFGHAQMVDNTLASACRSAARYGSTSGVTTAEVRQAMFDVMAPVVEQQAITLIVKDASVIDNGGDIPATMVGCQAMADIELDNALPRQPFLVRAEVRYRDVATIVLPFFGDIVLTGQSVTRHE